MNQEIDITGVVLHTPRLTLRPWREEDLEDFYAYARVDGVGQMAGWLPHHPGTIHPGEKDLRPGIQGPGGGLFGGGTVRRSRLSRVGAL